ncbi:MAG: alpha/beta hydrolase fold domain-containing protein [Myxococcales bacterium]|nr:alpha/beta hydrolase fold domain-containing protein [Myxococcales bacterium]
MARTSLGTFLYGSVFLPTVQLLFRKARHWPGVLRGLEVTRDVPYGPLPAQKLDVYRPAATGAASLPAATEPGGVARPGGLPVVIHIHGGGFRYFSKDTHWAMAAAFARTGALVFNVDYRLAPAHRYPAAFDDVVEAALHVARVAPGLGGDLSRLVLAGESAGANLVTGLAIALCWRQEDERLASLYDRLPAPRVLLPACGYLEVSHPERHAAERKIAPFIEGRIHQVTEQYLPDHRDPKPSHRFANPLAFLESAPPPDRPFPATFALVGSNDPVIGDTVRIAPAVRRLGATGETKVYEGGMHAFHAMRWKGLAKQAWTDQLAFMAKHQR